MRVAFLILALTACTSSQPQGVSTQSIRAVDSPYVTLAAGRTDDLSVESCSSNYGVCQVLGDASGSSISGMDSAWYLHGDLAWIRNIGAYPITILNDAFSTSGNRFFTSDGQDMVLRPGRGALFYLALDYTQSPPPLLGFRGLETNGIYGVISTASPTRIIGTTFQPSVTRSIKGNWSVRVATSTTLILGSIGRVELRSDSSSPPTTVRARCAGGDAAGLTVNHVTECQFSYTVPLGDYVRLVSVDEAGTPTYTVTAVAEQTW